MASKWKYNYLPEFRAFLTGRPKPSMVTVNLTSRCNQRCIYCEIGQGIPSAVSDSLSQGDMFWILDEMASHKIRRISLCGGEPFLYSGLMDVIAYAGERKIRCSVTSNGMTLHKLKETDFDILRKYKSDINLSIDSFEEDVQTLTRGTPSALENALKSLEKLRAESIPTTVLAAISIYNYRELYHFIVTAHRIGIKQVLFQPIIHYTNYPDRPAIEEKTSLNVPIDQLDVLLKNLREILRFEKNHDINTNVYRILPWIKAYLFTAGERKGKWFFEEVLKSFYCREIDATIDIAYDGGIQPCGLTRANVNIHDRQGTGLLELWEEATRGIKDDISHGRYYVYCNACCHKFSRNMMASVMKYPWKNRKALGQLAPLVLSRMVSQSKKKLSMVKK
jgi:MoaA/NifB/PqqE/SkfB family radical SAM enzyme